MSAAAVQRLCMRQPCSGCAAAVHVAAVRRLYMQRLCSDCACSGCAVTVHAAVVQQLCSGSASAVQCLHPHLRCMCMQGELLSLSLSTARRVQASRALAHTRVHSRTQARTHTRTHARTRVRSSAGISAACRSSPSHLVLCLASFRSALSDATLRFDLALGVRRRHAPKVAKNIHRQAPRQHAAPRRRCRVCARRAGGAGMRIGSISASPTACPTRACICVGAHHRHRGREPSNGPWHRTTACMHARLYTPYVYAYQHATLAAGGHLCDSY